MQTGGMWLHRFSGSCCKDFLAPLDVLSNTHAAGKLSASAAAPAPGQRCLSQECLHHGTTHIGLLPEVLTWHSGK